MGSVLQPNKIKHCLVTQHIHVFQSDKRYSSMFERRKWFTMFDVVQILSNMIQRDQTRCPNGKCLITLFDPVGSTNISRLDRAFVAKTTTLLTGKALCPHSGVFFFEYVSSYTI